MLLSFCVVIKVFQQYNRSVLILTIQYNQCRIMQLLKLHNIPEVICIAFHRLMEFLVRFKYQSFFLHVHFLRGNHINRWDNYWLTVYSDEMNVDGIVWIHLSWWNLMRNVSTLYESPTLNCSLWCLDKPQFFIYFACSEYTNVRYPESLSYCCLLNLVAVQDKKQLRCIHLFILFDIGSTEELHKYCAVDACIQYILYIYFYKLHTEIQGVYFGQFFYIYIHKAEFWPKDAFRHSGHTLQTPVLIGH